MSSWGEEEGAIYESTVLNQFGIKNSYSHKNEHLSKSYINLDLHDLMNHSLKRERDICIKPKLIKRRKTAFRSTPAKTIPIKKIFLLP